MNPAVAALGYAPMLIPIVITLSLEKLKDDYGWPAIAILAAVALLAVVAWGYWHPRGVVRGWWFVVCTAMSCGSGVAAVHFMGTPARTGLVVVSLVVFVLAFAASLIALSAPGAVSAKLLSQCTIVSLAVVVLVVCMTMPTVTMPAGRWMDSNPVPQWPNPQDSGADPQDPPPLGWVRGPTWILGGVFWSVLAAVFAFITWDPTSAEDGAGSGDRRPVRPQGPVWFCELPCVNPWVGRQWVGLG